MYFTRLRNERSKNIKHTIEKKKKEIVDDNEADMLKNNSRIHHVYKFKGRVQERAQEGVQEKKEC